jgi:hypothetical protein
MLSCAGDKLNICRYMAWVVVWLVQNTPKTGHAIGACWVTWDFACMWARLGLWRVHWRAGMVLDTNRIEIATNEVALLRLVVESGTGTVLEWSMLVELARAKRHHEVCTGFMISLA